MKKLVSVTEVEGEGLETFLGEKIMLMCMNFNYAGTLIGVNKTCVLLDAKDACIVYETGEWSAASWKDAQKLNKPTYVQIDKIEAFFGGK